mmetsp:Transcript_41596/g.75412  ORF Transcript_41596/g.75412 Transcript_41596/m.75412 type:complete len:285 (-) Transcript_41596:92-946(-)
MAPSSANTSMPSAMRYALIFGSSAVAETLTFPIDFVKTRMQLHKGSRGFVVSLREAVQSGGLTSLYSGLVPALCRHAVYSSLRISFYEDLRTWAAGGPGLEVSAGAKALAGLAAGASAQAIASPFDRLKVLLVRGGSGPKQGMFEVAAGVLRTEGVRGFYKGVVPNVQRAAAVNLGELATYDQAKTMILQSSGLEDGVIVHTLSATCSGLVASFCATPADLVKSRMMGGTATGVISCVRDTVRQEGVTSMWRGFLPNWARLGPWQLAFWVSYEHLRTLAGYSGF